MVSQTRFVTSIILPFTVFLSSFLIFTVQPLVVRFLLPQFGGSVTVWTVTLFFFMGMLSIGYFFVYVLKKVKPKKMIALYLGILFASLTFVVCLLLWWEWPYLKPITFGNEGNIFFHLFLTLFISIGLPYVLLSMSVPLLQHGLELYENTQKTFSLYRWSNIGSLTGLLSYAFVFQPFFTLSVQRFAWFSLFCACVVSLGISFYLLYKKWIPKSKEVKTFTTPPTVYLRNTLFFWILIPFLSASILMSVTTQVGLSAGSFTTILLLPLVAYLLSYIAAFRESSPKHIQIAIILSVLSTVVVLWKIPDAHTYPLKVQVSWAVLFVYSSCYLLHKTVYQKQPANKGGLPLYYMLSSFGSAFGAFVIVVIAPIIFSTYKEVYIVLSFQLIFLMYILKNSFFPRHSSFTLRNAFVGLALVGIIIVLPLVRESKESWIVQVRNFYGVLSVGEVEVGGDRLIKLLSGNTVHGMQYVNHQKIIEPTTYYSRTSGIGLLLENYPTTSKIHVYAAGLGVGTLAAYCDSFERLEFVEINPAVVIVAEKFFTYQSLCREKIVVQVGDARLMVAQSNVKYDLIVVDAFTDDVIPEHLLTVEAIETYLAHMKEDGILAIHISNRFLNLEPLMNGIRKQLHLYGMVYQDDTSTQSSLVSRWAFFSTNSTILKDVFQNTRYKELIDSNPAIVWTDQKSSILGLLIQ